MPTDKPKIQIYLAQEMYKQVLNFCSSEATSQSELGSKAIAEFINPNVVSIELDQQTMQKLEKWATKERRLPEQQAQVIIEKVLDELED